MKAKRLCLRPNENKSAFSVHFLAEDRRSKTLKCQKRGAFCENQDVEAVS